MAAERRTRSHVRLYLYALSTGCLVAVALLAACIVVDMRNAEGLPGVGGWMVPGSARRGELLMTDLEGGTAALLVHHEPIRSIFLAMLPHLMAGSLVVPCWTLAIRAFGSSPAFRPTLCSTL